MCYAGRVVGCYQGSSADAVRYPRGMEQNGCRFVQGCIDSARSVEFMHRFSTHLKTGCGLSRGGNWIGRGNPVELLKS